MKKRAPRTLTILSLSKHERSILEALAISHPSKSKTRLVAALLAEEHARKTALQTSNKANQ